jgi:hypothetical protein
MALAHGGKEIYIQNFGKKISAERDLEDLGVGLWTALKWILKKQFM